MKIFGKGEKSKKIQKKIQKYKKGLRNRRITEIVLSVSLWETEIKKKKRVS